MTATCTLYLLLFHSFVYMCSAPDVGLRPDYCGPGYYGLYCADICPYPYYGKHCDYTCSCVEKYCSHVNGCIRITVSSCPNGFIGSYCESKCSFPSFGQGCQQKCICAQKDCHYSTGCPKKLVVTKHPTPIKKLPSINKVTTNKKSPSPMPVTTFPIRAERTECASYCLTTTACGTILFDNKIEYGQEGLCTLVTESSPGSPYVLENNSSVCFMKKSSVETTPSMGEIIIDIIDNVYDMCTTTSKYDIAIVTTNGVHLYDYTQTLTTGACRNMTIAELFQGFASLPDRITWKALLNFNNTYFDLFTDVGQVYRWKKDSGSIVPVSGYPKTEQAYIADVVHYTPTNVFSGARWAVYTHLTGVATLYFFDASKIYYHRSQPPYEGSFSINDTTNMDNNGRPINLWYNLPSNVVGVTEHENLHTSLFIVVDVNLNVYFYHLPDPNDVNTSPPVCSLQGQLRL